MTVMTEIYEQASDDPYMDWSDESLDESFAEPDSEDSGYESERFRFGPRSRTPLPRTATPIGDGVSRAMLRTPRGHATVQLSESVVSKRLFDTTVTTLRSGINRVADRTNAQQRDVMALSGRITTAGNRQRKELQKLRTDTATWQKQNTAALARARREQQNSTMMILLVTLLFNDPGTGTGQGTKNDNLVLLLALMPMMGGYGGDSGSSGTADGSNTMWLILLLALSGRFGTTQP